MNELNRGEFFGTHYQKSCFGELIITDTEYTHNEVDWHYHANPYFTYLLQGSLFEANKKESYYLTPGSLLFHNWQDSHYNIKPPEYTRGFHIELSSKWLKKNELCSMDFEGSLNLTNPMIKGLINKVFLETKINDKHSKLSVELLMADVFSRIKNHQTDNILRKPDWIKKLQELLIDSETDFSLSKLGKELNIHPVHLSREFHRYFGVTLGRYIRQLRVNKAVALIMANRFSMTEICYKCGFYDQSHFISNFKSIYNTTPSNYLKKIS